MKIDLFKIDKFIIADENGKWLDGFELSSAVKINNRTLVLCRKQANGVEQSESNCNTLQVSKRCSHCLNRKNRPNAAHRYELNQCQISGNNLTDIENHSCEHYKPIPNVC